MLKRASGSSCLILEELKLGSDKCYLILVQFSLF